MSRTTSRSSTIRATSVGLLFAMALVACGQKPGVHVSGAGNFGSTGGDGSATGGDGSAGSVTDGSSDGSVDGTSDGSVDGTTSDGSTDGTASTSDGSSTSGTSGTSSSSSSSGTTGTSGTSGSTGSSSSSSGGNKPTGSDRTGAEAERIVIGIHAPVTGAAPLPSSSFEKASMYWDYVTGYRGSGTKAAAAADDAGPVLGRPRVEVVFKDDKYKPSSAVQACSEMAKSNKAFLLVGGGGTDQIQACGRWADQNKVPYFSAGVTELGLRGLPYYFASSASYKQQGLLLAQFLKKNFAGKKVQMIVTDTPNFQDAIDGFEAAAAQVGGFEYVGHRKHPKGDESWYAQYALQSQQDGVEVIFPLTAPVDYIKFAKAADGQNYRPQFVGVGLTMGLNTVANAVCPSADKAIFFSPFPGVDKIGQLDPEFVKAAGPDAGDDLVVALWGLNKVLHEAFKGYGRVYGNDLTREDFRNVVEGLTLKTNVFGDVKYSPSDHFGGKAVHVLKADCGTRKYNTIATFATGF